MTLEYRTICKMRHHVLIDVVLDVTPWFLKLSMPRACNHIFVLITVHTLLFRGITLFPSHAFLWDFGYSRRRRALVLLSPFSWS